MDAPLSLNPSVTISARHDTSAPLREASPMSSQRLAPMEMRELPLGRLPGVGEAVTRGGADPVLQSWPGENLMPSPLLNFEGVGNINGVAPPDTNGDVGPNHYVQWVNLSLAVYSKAGTLLLGPMAGNELWSGFGGVCETTNHGDPIVLYDHLADRWMLSQFSVGGGPDGFHQCIAVSQTGDPTGAWHRYDFLTSPTLMNDYPKFGVWPDGYYMSVNQFDSGSWAFAGVGVAVFERDQMLQGLPARMVYFDQGLVAPDLGGLLPADLDGPPPPLGTPNYFLAMVDDAWGYPHDQLNLWEFRVDWANPANSSFGNGGLPNLTLPTAAFDSNLCGGSRDCIPQPGGASVDAIADRLMFRLQYRHFAGYDTMVVNHTVDVNGMDHAGVRWYELHDPGAGWSIYQQGTYAPDSNHRWMGSAALDGSGNLALGYSVSSASVYPSIRYTGRLSGDPLGTLPQGETSIIEGGGSQTGVNRWGDYSMMAVDPVDQCTFWYTQEYLSTTSGWGWQTRIAAFKFPSCTTGPSGSLQGTVRNLATSEPIPNARVTAGVYTTYTGPDGHYQFRNIPADDYDLGASAYGYFEATANGVAVLDGQTTVQNFALSARPAAQVQGTVRDGSGHNWPLHARIDVSATGFSATIFTDPSTGSYSIPLLVNESYTFAVSASGYQTLTREITPVANPSIEDFNLTVTAECSAPGYTNAYGYNQDFEADNGGYTVVTSGYSSWEWGSSVLSGPGAAHSGSSCWGTNLYGNYADGENGCLTSPPIDLSAYSGNQLQLEWWQWLVSEGCCDHAWVDITSDGGSVWDNIYPSISGNIDPQWTRHQHLLDPSYATANFRVRFCFSTDGSVTYPGYFIDDVSISGGCSAESGGLIVGHVYDANFNHAINGAEVQDINSGRTAVTVATPEDPNLDDGFYTLFAPTGWRLVEAAGQGGYGLDAGAVFVSLDNVAARNFHLPAGLVNPVPDVLNVTLAMGETANRLVTLNNGGGLDAGFEFVEINAPYNPSGPSGPFADPVRHLGPKKLNLTTLAGTPYYLTQPEAPPLAAGDVIQVWNAGLTCPWGIGFNLLNDDLWLGSIAAGGGDDRDHRFLRDGSNTGEAIDTSGWAGIFAADMAYNPLTNMLWQLDVGAGDCIHELDPATLIATGNVICPSFGVSQRGLAYDPLTDTFYAGGWNDSTIHHFDSSGAMLDSVNVGLAISGLALNPGNGHLFVITNYAGTDDVYVLDVNDNYNILGSLSIPGMGDFEQAGLEMDSLGHLWAVNQVTGDIIEVDSGETYTGSLDIPWLSEVPTNGLIIAGGNTPTSFILDASGMGVGLYSAHVRVRTDTPYHDSVVRVNLEVTAPHDGIVAWESPYYGMSGPAGLYVMDIDLANTGSISVSVTSSSDPSPSLVNLVEAPAGSGIFRGAAILGVDVAVSGGDTLIAQYLDADDGHGGLNVLKHAYASIDGEPPTMFAGLDQALPGDGQVRLSWYPALDLSLPITYNIYRATTSGGQNFSTPLDATTAVSYVDRTVVNCQRYYYVVRAEDAFGNEDTNTVQRSVIPRATTGAGGSEVDILVYAQYTSTEDWDYVNAVNAVAQVSASSGIAYTIEDLYDYTQLGSELADKDVLLIPANWYGGAATFQTVGAAWAPDLQTFVNNGGVVVLMDSWVATWNLFDRAGLMDINGWANAPIYGLIDVDQPANPIMTNVPNPYQGIDYTMSYDTGEAGAVSSYLDDPVVIDKTIGSGHAVLIGHDLYTTNSEEMEIVGNAALRLANRLSRNGMVSWDSDAYSTNAMAGIELTDVDLACGGIAGVNVWSDTDPLQYPVILTEDYPGAGVFHGAVELGTEVLVTDGDLVTVMYLDHNDGQGGLYVSKFDYAQIDGAPPMFDGLVRAVPGYNSVTLSWNAAWDPYGPITYSIYRAETPGGQNFSQPLATTEDLSYVDRSAVACHQYYYVVRAQDVLGNQESNTVEHSAKPHANPGLAETNILVFAQYADQGPGGDLQNVMAAVNQVATAQGLTYHTTLLTDYTQLAGALTGQDVLLIPQQENANDGQIYEIGTAWASVLPAFVSNGGVVALADFAEYNSGSWPILRDSGLMWIDGIWTTFWDSGVDVVNPQDPVAAEVATPYLAQYGSMGYWAWDGNVVVSYAGGIPVVVHKTMGLGHVVLIGHDYTVSNSEQNKIVGNAVLRVSHSIGSNGVILWDREVYRPDDLAGIELRDADLACGGTAAVNVYSGATVGFYPTQLTEDFPGAGVFHASVQLGTEVPVSHGDVITVEYLDADDGMGNSNIYKYDWAAIDGLPPYFDGLVSATPGFNSVTLAWDPASDDHGPITYSIYRAPTSHGQNFSIPLATTQDLAFVDRTVTNCLRYYYVVRAQDAPGNQETNTVQRLAIPRTIGGGGGSGQVAVFQDEYPWGYGSVQDILNANSISYSMFSSADIGNVDLSTYAKVIIPSYQPGGFYLAVANNRAWFESWIQAGGVFEIHGAEGDAWDALTMPGGLTKVYYGSNDLTIQDPGNPLVQNVDSNEIDNWGASAHGYFTGWGAPPTVIITEDTTGGPVLLEFGYGSGKVIATMMTVEHGYANGFEADLLPNLVLSGLGDVVSSNGRISWDQEIYDGNETARIEVADADLACAAQVMIDVWSDTDDVPYPVILWENTAGTGVLRGELELDLDLPVSDGDSIYALYLDFNDGQGGMYIPKIDEAQIDGGPPVFAGLVRAIGGFNRITLSWDPATDPHGPITYSIYRAGTAGGQNFNVPLGTTGELSFVDQDVAACQQYYYVVRAEDSLGHRDTNLVERSARPNANPDVEVNVLVYSEFTSNGEWDYINAVNAVAQVSASSGISYTIEDLNDYTHLSTELMDKDVLLIPGNVYGNASIFQTVGAAWATDLQNFVANGGVVVQVEGPPETWNLVNSAGLISVSGWYYSIDDLVNVDQPANPIMTNVNNPYLGVTDSFSYSTLEGGAVSSYYGTPVVIDKPIGAGHAVLIGHDLYYYNSDEMAIVGNAVLRLARPSGRDGIVAWDQDIYNPASAAMIQLTDLDLACQGSAAVNVWSTSSPTPVPIVLDETTVGFGRFTALVALGTGLQVIGGDSITVKYIDADDGRGGVNVPKIDLAFINFGLDSDGDGLADTLESNTVGTDPYDPDTDDDGVGDGVEYNHAPCYDPLVPDSDGDGLCDGSLTVPGECDAGEDQNNNGEQDPGETSACNADSDSDGLDDLLDNGGCLSPLIWDSDGDHLPDGFEQDNLTNPLGALDPCLTTDGDLDFDGEGNSNAHEYWNGSDPWNTDPVPGVYDNPGCYYWADGDGDGIPAPSDIVKLKLEIAGVAQEYRDILPHGIDTLDLDRDGHAAPSDQVLLKLIVAISDRPGGYPSQAGMLEVVSAPTGSVAVGSTTHVTVSVNSASGGVPYAPGFGVMFEVVSGNALLLGGDGTANGQPVGNRYDFSMEAAAGARANIVVLVTGPGPISIGAKVPACGIAPNGRWNDLVDSAPIVINDN
jgi:hypothetical protein